MLPAKPAMATIAARVERYRFCWLGGLDFVVGVVKDVTKARKPRAVFLMSSFMVQVVCFVWAAFSPYAVPDSRSPAVGAPQIDARNSPQTAAVAVVLGLMTDGPASTRPV